MFSGKTAKKNIFKQEAKKIIQISARNREAMTRGSREIFERITTYKWPDYTTKPKKNKRKKINKIFRATSKIICIKRKLNWMTRERIHSIRGYVNRNKDRLRQTFHRTFGAETDSACEIQQQINIILKQ